VRFFLSDYADQLSEAFRSAVAQLENAPPPKHGTLRCPVCGELMLIEDVLGVTTDVCRKHGVWLDTGELPSIIDQVRAGTRRAAAQAISDARIRGKVSGIFFGAFSFLFDPFSDE
jgi:Zn-finger nucleic acid-binding protein